MYHIYSDQAKLHILSLATSSSIDLLCLTQSASVTSPFTDPFPVTMVYNYDDKK